MKSFSVNIQGVLKAENLDDAFTRIGKHFTSLASDEEYSDSPFEPPTNINIRGISETDKNEH